MDWFIVQTLIIPSLYQIYRQIQEYSTPGSILSYFIAPITIISADDFRDNIDSWFEVDRFIAKIMNFMVILLTFGVGFLYLFLISLSNYLFLISRSLHTHIHKHTHTHTHTHIHTLSLIFYFLFYLP